MKFFIMAAIFILAACTSSAQKGEIFQKDGAAIGGYDVVAFFREQKPVKGSAQYSIKWKDATWHFASAESLQAFEKSPDRYAPQYGGYCAYGTAGGYKAPTEADTWTIVNDKLYFNYNKEVQELWNKDIPGYIEKANANWPKIKDKQ